MPREVHVMVHMAALPSLSAEVVAQKTTLSQHLSQWHHTKHHARARRHGAGISIRVRCDVTETGKQPCSVFCCAVCSNGVQVERVSLLELEVSIACLLQQEKDLTEVQKEEQQGTALQHFVDSDLFFVDKVTLLPFAHPHVELRSNADPPLCRQGMSTQPLL